MRWAHVAIPPATRVYAIGDVHGRADCLADAFARIDADEVAFPVENATEILLGDYIDRGPDSRGAIDLILARRERRRVVTLCGNHEDMLLGFLRRPHTFQSWLANGGLATLSSYGVDLDGMPSAGEAASVRDAFLAALPPAHLVLLGSLKDSFGFGGCFFVHAGVRPGIALPDQSRDDLLWIRDEFLRSDADFGALVVHGHSVAAEPEVRANRVNLDTGAYYSGRLTCLALENGGGRFL